MDIRLARPTLRIAGFVASALLAVLLCGCVTVVKETDKLPSSLPAGKGALVVVIDSNRPFRTLRVKQSGDVFAAVAAKNIPAGRSVRFIVLPAGHYGWVRTDINQIFGFHAWVDLDKGQGKKRFEFDVKAGTVNYPGDFILRTEGSAYTVSGMDGKRVQYWTGDRYFLATKDRAAMLLGDLTPNELAIIRQLGMVYTGPGQDVFPEYYLKLAGK